MTVADVGEEEETALQTVEENGDHSADRRGWGNIYIRVPYKCRLLLVLINMELSVVTSVPK